MHLHIILVQKTATTEEQKLSWFCSFGSDIDANSISTEHSFTSTGEE